MRESFDEYKNTIESNVIKFDYLYSGDIISSFKETYSTYNNNSKVSPKSIIDCIDSIYEFSIKDMINSSIDLELNYTLDGFKSGKYRYIDLFKSLHFNNFDPSYIFISKKSLKIFETLFHNEDENIFPLYFKPLSKYVSHDISVLYTPYIEDSEDELNIYVVDKSIQSLVYIIQNMEYNIESSDGCFKHIIDYPLYKCNYNCYKLTIKNIEKIREDKINSVLDEN
jgi:hypothetical protein